MRINVEMFDLQAFATLAECESFSRAAESLNTSQPALSRRIRRLEEVIGAQLFSRTTRHVTLTKRGHALLPAIKKMLADFTDNVLVNHPRRDAYVDVLEICCLPTVTNFLLVDALRQLDRTFPRTKVRIADCAAFEGAQKVLQDEIDFGINLENVALPQLEFFPLVEDSFVLVCPAKHPLAQRSGVKWTELLAYPLVCGDRASANRVVLDSSLSREEATLPWRYELSHTATILTLVDAGLGLAVLPGLAVSDIDHSRLRKVAIADKSISRTIGLLKRRGRRLSRQGQFLFEFLLQKYDPNVVKSISNII